MESHGHRRAPLGAMIIMMRLDGSVEFPSGGPDGTCVLLRNLESE